MGFRTKGKETSWEECTGWSTGLRKTDEGGREAGPRGHPPDEGGAVLRESPADAPDAGP